MVNGDQRAASTIASLKRRGKFRQLGRGKGIGRETPQQRRLRRGKAVLEGEARSFILRGGVVGDLSRQVQRQLTKSQLGELEQLQNRLASERRLTERRPRPTPKAPAPPPAETPVQRRQRLGAAEEQRVRQEQRRVIRVSPGFARKIRASAVTGAPAVSIEGEAPAEVEVQRFRELEPIDGVVRTTDVGVRVGDELTERELRVQQFAEDIQAQRDAEEVQRRDLELAELQARQVDARDTDIRGLFGTPFLQEQQQALAESRIVQRLADVPRSELELAAARVRLGLLSRGAQDAGLVERQTRFGGVGPAIGVEQGVLARRTVVEPDISVLEQVRLSEAQISERVAQVQLGVSREIAERPLDLLVSAPLGAGVRGAAAVATRIVPRGGILTRGALGAAGATFGVQQAQVIATAQEPGVAVGRVTAGILPFIVGAGVAPRVGRGLRVGARRVSLEGRLEEEAIARRLAVTEADVLRQRVTALGVEFVPPTDIPLRVGPRLARARVVPEQTVQATIQGTALTPKQAKEIVRAEARRLTETAGPRRIKKLEEDIRLSRIETKVFGTDTTGIQRLGLEGLTLRTFNIPAPLKASQLATLRAIRNLEGQEKLRFIAQRTLPSVEKGFEGPAALQKDIKARLLKADPGVIGDVLEPERGVGFVRPSRAMKDFGVKKPDPVLPPAPSLPKPRAPVRAPAPQVVEQETFVPLEELLGAAAPRPTARVVPAAAQILPVAKAETTLAGRLAAFETTQQAAGPFGESTLAIAIGARRRLAPPPFEDVSQVPTIDLATALSADLVQRPVTRVVQRQVVVPRQRVVQRLTPLLKVKQRQVLKPAVEQRLGLKTSQVSIQKVVPEVAQKQRAALRVITVPKLKQVTRALPRRRVITVRAPPRPVTRPRRRGAPFIGLPPLLAPSARRVAPIRVPGFQVQVRRRGEFVPITRAALPKGLALRVGAREVERTAAATFRLVPTGVRVKPSKVVQGLPPFQQRKFRPPKEGGTLTFIEKTEFRINTPGEKREITAKGLLALQRKRSVKIL